MALFNKLFTNRRSTHNKHEDNVSEKLFAFSKDQVRVVLFRECDFRGRKLLFDSSSVKKVQSADLPKNDDEKISEITDGFGYIYTKPQPDFNQLAEMVFGSVAMSFRGTYFKMHSLDAPNRLMLTQVFSSPRPATRRISVSSRCDPLEHSKLDDSGASSTNSMSENLSVYSTASDTILVCRRQHSSPLNVPNEVSTSIPSLVGDSGYCAAQSYTNHHSGPSSLSTCNSDNLSFSSNTLYKKWLRKTSFSLGQSSQSSTCSEVFGPPRQHHRCSKLGLAFILELTPGEEDALADFIMEHVSLMEAMLWRARQVIERAYIKQSNFASLMMDMTQISSQYLVNLLSGAYLSSNLWLSLSNGCDISNSIRAFSSIVGTNGRCSKFEQTPTIVDNSLFHFGWFLPASFNIKKNFSENKGFSVDKFVRDFCELLETIDVKDTNFFMSTLVTAVLTHHLGWVNTCLPSGPADSLYCKSRPPFNPLWSELSDLYGAIGYPTKMAQTIITGTSRKDLISKILPTLTYFIRCCDVDRRVPVRVDIEKENAIIETLCRKAGSIPKENFKKYGDHLKEIMSFSSEFLVMANNNNYYHNQCPENGAATGLKRTQTCRGSFLEAEPDKMSQTEAKVREDSDRSVVFVLGDSDQLIGLKKDKTPDLQRPTFIDLNPDFAGPKSQEFRDEDFVENAEITRIKPSTSWSLLSEKALLEASADFGSASKFARSQSVPPEDRADGEQVKNKSKYRYSGVKFNLKQYPQILSNYMKSKNLEMTHLQFGDKGLKIDELSETIKLPEMNIDYEEGEALQTPSNASELEGTSELGPQQAQESCVDPPMEHVFIKQRLPNTRIECSFEEDGLGEKITPNMRIAILPMPKLAYTHSSCKSIKYTSSLMRAVSHDYMPDMVLQAPLLPKSSWESKLKNDLVLASQHSLLDHPVDEAVAILANIDSWEVQLISSHTFVIDKGSSGIRVGMSQLVSNMLESLLKMWKLNVSPHYCLMHIEQTLQELCIRSKALAELLLTSEFCSMEQVTSTLQLEVNDVPLLLAVASTHSPQVTQKYGLSFQ